MAKVAWLGTGLLGAGFVEGLRARGDAVTVWNRTPDKARALEAVGAVVAATPAEAARGAERVHVCVSDDAAVDAVIDALGALPEGVPVIDHTTVSAAGARARAARFAATGRPFLSCPVFMAPSNAKSATGMMLCAGRPADVERWRPALAAMTGQLVEYGEDAGVPAAIKLFGNAMILSVVGALSDALTVATGSGVDAATALALLDQFPIGGVVSSRGRRIVAGDHRASFELTMARKDLRLMLEAAEGAPLSVLPELARRMDALIADGHGAKDLAVLGLHLAPRAPAG